ncbi:MAG: hypothetical protein ACRCTI_14955 [Beijerinckiaceae bacterium]
MWSGSAMVTTSVAIFAMSAFLGIPWPLWGVVVVSLLVTLASHCFSLTLEAAALLVLGARNVISAVATMTVTCVGGVVVPVTDWQAPIQWLAQAVPVTHGLAAVRGIQDGAAPGAIAVAAVVTVAVGIARFVAARVACRGVYERSCRGLGPQ